MFTTNRYLNTFSFFSKQHVKFLHTVNTVVVRFNYLFTRFIFLRGATQGLSFLLFYALFLVFL